MIRALTRAGGNVSEAARALGVGRATLYRRMKRLGIGENPT
ncbi:helix-turn-helix domain-containing protein [Roseibium salinum]|nr:helix-turn-helix domain-containing protein [Roseibium salinum]